MANDRYTMGADGTSAPKLRKATAEDYKQFGLPVPEHLQGKPKAKAKTKAKPKKKAK